MILLQEEKDVRESANRRHKKDFFKYYNIKF